MVSRKRSAPATDDTFSFGRGVEFGGSKQNSRKVSREKDLQFLPTRISHKIQFCTHTDTYNGDHYHECLISRANFAIFLFPWVFDYIIQVPAVTKYV